MDTLEAKIIQGSSQRAGVLLDRLQTDVDDSHARRGKLDDLEKRLIELETEEQQGVESAWGILDLEGLTGQ
ncbi:hypothetical protein Slin14017_G120380 [Septoria linicola]|nr:hypothetical protein Slin14017_G120380 [Septoria linicola]